jgi:glyoxylase-like metal-dependent hydrolase (beta-lactamase superfamily II)
MRFLHCSSRIHQLLLFAVLSTSLRAVAEPRNITQLAEGVYAIEHPGHRDDGLFSGNTTVVIGSRQVLVVDTAYLSEVTRADIAQIRQWTDKPVTFIVNTHFHNDHNLGNALYLQNFPAATILAHNETKKNMDQFGPGSSAREEHFDAKLQRMLDENKGPDGRPLSIEDHAYVKQVLDERRPYTEEIKKIKYQSATMTFDGDLSVDIGGRQVEIKFLGKGNTDGDAVVFLPKERIAVVGDLVGSPIPLANDGYPSQWMHTLENLAQLNAAKVVPGHGPVLDGNARILLFRDLLKSVVDQMNAKLTEIGPAMSHSVDEVRSAIDLAEFRDKFIGNNQGLVPEWDQFVDRLIKTTFAEASLR